MNEFKYTSRPYVSRVNLETLGKSFDTLEQGHKEAVKTASDLKTAIYNLQMDNSEKGINTFGQRLAKVINTALRKKN